MNILAQFHFLRPGLLLLLLPAILVFWSAHRRQDELRNWRGVIAPSLLRHLVLEDSAQRSGVRPLNALLCAWITGIVAIAGPAWQKEPSPFTEDQSALFIVLKVTPEMLAQDIQPSRLQRAAQKIGDLLELRPGTKTGLIAYAGSAHLVMPLTSDRSIITEFAAQLTPDVMPESGDDPAAALQLAWRRLAESELPGSVVLIADAVSPGQLQNLDMEQEPEVHLLAMAAGPDVIPPPGSPPAPALSRQEMENSANRLGGRLVLPTTDDSDVRRVNAGIETSIARAPAQEGERWKDNGYFLVPLLAMLMLAFFRPGGAVALS